MPKLLPSGENWYIIFETDEEKVAWAFRRSEPGKGASPAAETMLMGLRWARLKALRCVGRDGFLREKA